MPTSPDLACSLSLEAPVAAPVQLAARFDPASAAAVARALPAYLAPRLGAGELHFAEGPDEIVHGWETYVYRFRLRAEGPLPGPFDRPLVLRIYGSAQGVPRARREFAVQRALHLAGQPVAEPLVVEDGCGLFGSPFLIMEYLPGETLLDYLRHHKTHVLGVGVRLAEQHARLHRLPASDFPAPAGPFLERRLAEVGAFVRNYGLEGLAAGLDWLRTHRPGEPERPALLHLDFHPVNLMVAPGRPPAVLDWSEADVGDRHADVAATVLLIDSAPVENARLLDRLLDPPARWVLIRSYLAVYHRRLGLDRRTLRYYLAWAALRRLGMCGMWLRAGPQSNGCKPSSIRHLRTGHVEALQDCFRHCTGVEARVV